MNAETKQDRTRSTRCVVSDHKPSKETSLSESSFAIRRRSITTVDLVSPPAPCRRRVRVRARDLWSAGGLWSCVDHGAAAVWRLHRGWRRCTGSRHTLSEICSSICLSCASESASRSWLRCAIISTMSSSLRACVRAGRVSRRRRVS